MAIIYMINGILPIFSRIIIYYYRYERDSRQGTRYSAHYRRTYRRPFFRYNVPLFYIVVIFIYDGPCTAEEDVPPRGGHTAYLCTVFFRVWRVVS